MSPIDKNKLNRLLITKKNFLKIQLDDFQRNNKKKQNFNKPMLSLNSLAHLENVFLVIV